jgi:hypothetical protein
MIQKIETSNDLYQVYHSECLKAKTGKYPRLVQDFSKFENSENKVYFDRFLQTLNTYNDLVNPVLFIRALAEYHKGFFLPKVLNTMTAMRIYREFIIEFNKLEDPNDIYQRLLRDLKFVAEFCIENKLYDGLYEYFHHNEAFIPSAIKHCCAGNVSHFFLAACSTFPVIYKNYPSDSREMISNFDYEIQRSKLIFDPKCKTICDNLEHTLNMLILKLSSNDSK